MLTKKQLRATQHLCGGCGKGLMELHDSMSGRDTIAKWKCPNCGCVEVVHVKPEHESDQPKGKTIQVDFNR